MDGIGGGVPGGDHPSALRRGERARRRPQAWNSEGSRSVVFLCERVLAGGAKRRGGRAEADVVAAREDAAGAVRPGERPVVRMGVGVQPRGRCILQRDACIQLVVPVRSQGVGVRPLQVACSRAYLVPADAFPVRAALLAAC